MFLMSARKSLWQAWTRLEGATRRATTLRHWSARTFFSVQELRLLWPVNTSCSMRQCLIRQPKLEIVLNVQPVGGLVRGIAQSNQILPAGTAHLSALPALAHLPSSTCQMRLVHYRDYALRRSCVRIPSDNLSFYMLSKSKVYSSVYSRLRTQV